MAELDSRPLHLYTLDSLLVDLVLGRSVRTREGQSFELSTEASRGVLNWYRRRGKDVWPNNVNVQSLEDLVDAALSTPNLAGLVPTVTMPPGRRRLRLRRLTAHRFAGLHKFGTPAVAPADFVFDFKSALTLFEGRNGSGKTSLLNAIVWVMTGELLRAQREPECAIDYDCYKAATNPGDEPTAHRISAVTPLPSPQHFVTGSAVLADTWVELIFEDEAGVALPPIRRSVSRTVKNKLQENAPDLSVLQVDPIALQLGTTMPSLLSLIRVGSSSELGKAVSELTGLSALVDLADHVRRARGKINGDLTKSKQSELKRCDENYRKAKEDLATATAKVAVVAAQPPEPSADAAIEALLDAITDQYELAKSSAFHDGREILGKEFDPGSTKLLGELEHNVSRAIERAARPQDLPSAKRLGGIRQVTPDQLAEAAKQISNLLREGDTLRVLTENPAVAARKRLYAKVATWMSDHPNAHAPDGICVLCGSDDVGAIDPVTGGLVNEHLREAQIDAELVSMTLGKWAAAAEAELLQGLPEVLRVETVQGLPDHPCDLLRAALVEELFEFEVLGGVLGVLKVQTGQNFDRAAKGHSGLSEAKSVTLPPGCEKLEQTLRRLDKVLRFAAWRRENKEFEKELFSQVLSGPAKEALVMNEQSLMAKLSALDSMVKASQPVSDALKQCGRLKQSLAERRLAETRLRAYGVAEQALCQIAEMGRLADDQVAELRRVLSAEAATWRDKIYLGAFPSTAHDLVDTPVGRNGELGLMMGVSGVLAPAEYISNASALRASLVAFYLAFRQHVLDQRGGIETLLLDDPQELLDDENRDRFAAAFNDAVGQGAQLILTSYDARFCRRISRLPLGTGLSHYSVHPATDQQPTVRLCEPLSEIAKRREHFVSHPDDEESARNFADACRVFLEARLGDLFDDPAYSAWVSTNRDPTLFTFVERLRPMVRTGTDGMFNHHAFRRFVDHPALASGSRVTTLMNKVHHGSRSEVRAADVGQCTEELHQLLEIVEEMYGECLRWKRRDAVQQPQSIPIPPLAFTITASAASKPPIPIYASLAAASTQSGSADSQETAELFDFDVLRDKRAYILRRPNFGFAAPSGSIAIVDELEGPVEDRRLVIARTTQMTFARRLVRGKGTHMVGLTADIPDPRTKAPKTIMISENEVALHRVVGIMFDHRFSYQPGQEEAILVDTVDLMKDVVLAFRVKDHSAVPLALEKQVVLGGEEIQLSELNRHLGKLAAISLSDGSSQFKRIGSTLPGELGHLRQFESIGGLGVSQMFSIGKEIKGVLNVLQVRSILGVLYHA